MHFAKGKSVKMTIYLDFEGLSLFKYRYEKPFSEWHMT